MRTSLVVWSNRDATFFKKIQKNLLSRYLKTNRITQGLVKTTFSSQSLIWFFFSISLRYEPASQQSVVPVQSQQVASYRPTEEPESNPFMNGDDDGDDVDG